MSGYPGGGGGEYEHHEEGYGHPEHQGGHTDSYYQDDQYYDQNYDAHGGHGGDGYYDES